MFPPIFFGAHTVRFEMGRTPKGYKNIDLPIYGMSETNNPNDPKNINGRLYDAVSTLLDNFQDMTVREQVTAVSAIARIQVLFMKIREDPSVPSSTGTTVKRYAKAFASNANKRKGVTGSDVAGLLEEPDDLEY